MGEGREVCGNGGKVGRCGNGGRWEMCGNGGRWGGVW